MTNAHTLSRRIVAELDPDGTKWPGWHKYHCICCGVVTLEHDGKCPRAHEIGGEQPYLLKPPIPDLAAPENLHLLLEVSKSLGGASILNNAHLKSPLAPFTSYFPHGKFGYGETESLAVFAAVCAALGIDTTQETTNAAD